MKDPFERPIKARTLIADLQTMLERFELGDAGVMISDDKRFLIINGRSDNVRGPLVGQLHQVSIGLVDEAFSKSPGQVKMKDPFERPIKAKTLITVLQSMLESLGLDDAEVTVSDNKRFLEIHGADERRASICLVEDVFDKPVGRIRSMR